MDSPTVICWTSVVLRGVGSVLSLLVYFSWKIPLAHTVDPDQTPHDVASELGLHCLQKLSFLRYPFSKGLSVPVHFNLSC